MIKDICQVDMKIGRPYVKTTEFASDSVIIMIGVTGEVRGQVLMSFPEAHALHVVSKMMMGMPVTALDDMSASAINELEQYDDGKCGNDSFDKRHCHGYHTADFMPRKCLFKAVLQSEYLCSADK